MPDLEVLSLPAETTPKLHPLLFVHGAWHAAWCWRETFMPYFAAQGYHVYALSLRGHGGSPNDRPLRLTRFRHYVQDVRQVVETLPATPIIIGHSMGGATLQKYLERYDAAAAVLLASMPSHGVLFAALRALQAHPVALLKCILQLRLYPLVATPQLAKWMFYADDLPLEEAARRQAKLSDESFLIFQEMLFILPRVKRVLARLASSKAPIHVVGGQHDTLFAAWETRRTAKAYGVEAHLFPMPHNLMQEKGWEAVAEDIRDWLAAYGL